MVRAVKYISGRSVRRGVRLNRKRMRRRAPGIGKSMLYSKPHFFKRSVFLANLQTSTGIGNGTLFGSLTPQLNTLPNVSEFGALYDQYRITKVVYRFSWRATGISAIEAADQTMGAPYMLWAQDRDDSGVPTTVNQLREYANCKEHYFNDSKRVCYITLIPNVLAMAYQTLTATSYSPAFNKWIDIGDGGVTPYYGLKYSIITPGTAPTRSNFFDVDATFYFQMKNPR